MTEYIDGVGQVPYEYDEKRVGRYMTAKRVPCAPKDVWMICDRSGSTLALVEWYPRWRKWTMREVEADAVFSEDCLASLAAWMEGLK
jgi:hypothetical protein